MSKQLFSDLHTTVETLIAAVKNGSIGLPDLQRPFVWKDNKVRDLLDSMFRGFPIGYIMLWQAPPCYDRKAHIGEDEKIYKEPEDLIIDGQQRLTALLGAIEGVPVKDKDYKSRHIRIAFNPLTCEFNVWSQGFERNTEYISAISDVFAAEKDHTIIKFRKQYINTVNGSREKKGEPLLTEDEEIAVEENINALLDLKQYYLPTLRVNFDVDEEAVSEIFVRVNSGGKKLTENNFIETLLAVFDNDVHDKINKFCETSRIPADGTAYNHILKVAPMHLIRIAVGAGFHRARLKYAYQLMRGKDLKTGIVSQDTRAENLNKFKEALNIATDLNNWHTYLNLYAQAGYISGEYVAASTAVIHNYVLYLIGKYEYNVKPIELNKIITKLIYMTTVTRFFTNSPETTAERIFADLRDVNTAEGFVKYLEKLIADRFTNDYFTVTLPKDLITSSESSPVWFGYIAAINVLGTPMLFSTSVLSKFLVPGANGTKKSIDRHHIFPKNYLENIGIKDDRDRNQVANYTYLDYNTNIAINDRAPAEYVGEYRTKLGEEGYKKACAENALPENFEDMEYFEFIAERRKLMAEIIKKGYEHLCKQ